MLSFSHPAPPRWYGGSPQTADYLQRAHGVGADQIRRSSTTLQRRLDREALAVRNVNLLPEVESVRPVEPEVERWVPIPARGPRREIWQHVEKWSRRGIPATRERLVNDVHGPAPWTLEFTKPAKTEAEHTIDQMLTDRQLVEKGGVIRRNVDLFRRVYGRMMV